MLHLKFRKIQFLFTTVVTLLHKTFFKQSLLIYSRAQELVPRVRTNAGVFGAFAFPNGGCSYTI